jgi:hypothetical protein
MEVTEMTVAQALKDQSVLTDRKDRKDPMALPEINMQPPPQVL